MNARVTLHASFDGALADPDLAALVRACAEESAEIQGVPPPDVAIFDDRVELSGTLPMPILLAIAAELRRSTGRWHLAKRGTALWRGD